MTHSVQGQFNRGAITAFGMQAGALTIAFGVQIGYARLLTPAEFGIFVQVVQATTIATTLLVLGIPLVHLQLVPKYLVLKRADLLRGWVRYSTIRSVGLTGLLTAAAWIALTFTGTAMPWRWGALLLVPMGMLALLQGFAMGLKSIVLGRTPSEMIRPALAFLLFWMAVQTESPTAITAVLTLLVANGLTLFTAAGWLRQVVPTSLRSGAVSIDGPDWSQRMAQFFGSGVFSIILDRADVLIVGWFMGPEAAGLYMVVIGLGKLLLFALVSVNTIAGPLVSELHHRGDRSGVQFVLRRGVAASGLLAVVGALFLGLLGAPLLSLFGDSYPAGLTALRIGLVGYVANALCGSCGLVVSMTGNQHITWRVIAGAACLMVLLDIVVVPHFGIEGAAAVRSLTMAAWNGSLALYAARVLGYHSSAVAWLPSKQETPWPDDNAS